MSRLIIIEGLDGCGKTTFADALWQTLEPPLVRFHAGPPQSDSYLDEYWHPLAFLSRFTVICDRWHLGEHVWPYLFDREPIKSFMPIVENRMLLMFNQIDAYYMYRDEDGMRSVRELDYDIEKACDLYDDAIDHSRLEWDFVTLDEVLARGQVLT